ncbi:hypothetical protein GCM10009524_47980 [Spirilliplanes yamanashiensis]
MAGILLDGIDVVVVRPPATPSAAVARALAARARKKGAVLILAGLRRAPRAGRASLGGPRARARAVAPSGRHPARDRPRQRCPAPADRHVAAPPSCADRGPRTAPAFVRQTSVERWLTLLEEQEARDAREREAGSPADGWT